MLCVRGFQRLKAVLSPPGNQSLRSLTASSDGVQQREEWVKMDNPFKEPQKGCILCNVPVDYKNIQLLTQFVSPHTGRIYGRHITGLCGRKQKEISRAIKKAQSIGFMSVTHKHPQLMKDPNICAINHLQ
ncbi:28S ribosomal protein S18c, mitochondrial [Dicentrarchus labrax]|uniref:Small ribosomal subunit protein bS18m n=1 Tax=Dicentrarchus labrax TaxID=13489 RepID=A0A8C4IHZ9_DICLA|nr:28S ribosomal protein S18c, mitochondrial [Dicentrarchus labrax]